MHPFTPSLTTLIAHTQATLEKIATEYTPAVLASSLSAEDMVLTDLILRHHLHNQITIFILDTGRLHAETLSMLDRIKAMYDYDIVVFRPKPEAIATYIEKNGLNAFYHSVEMRQACCRIRKIEPLNRALFGNRAWITGQRRTQAQTRTALCVQERDETRGIDKFNPLANWSHDDVWSYIHQKNIIYNPLHDAGYPSIGCAPCTRAINPGENLRAGRWWWETQESKECGLHHIDGKLVRIPPLTTSAPD